jgi:hypothetical protein
LTGSFGLLGGKIQSPRYRPTMIPRIRTASAAAVLLALASLTAGCGGKNPSGDSAIGATTATSATTTPSGTAASSGTPSPTPSTVALVPLTVPPAVFPYDLTYLPPGGGDTYVEMTQAGLTLRYGTLIEIWLLAQGAGNDPAGAQGVVTQTTVNGIPATQTVASLSSGTYVSLQWQQDGRVLRMQTYTVSADNLKRVAEGLRNGTTVNTRPAPITGIAAPPGYALSQWGSDIVCVGPTNVAPVIGTLCFYVLTGALDTGQQHIRDFNIDGSPAFTYQQHPNDPDRLVVHRTDGRWVMIAENPGVHGYTDDDLVAMYRGVVFAT